MRPMLWIVSFLISGILLARHLGGAVHVVPLAALFVLASAAGAIYFFMYGRRIALILPVFAVVGAIFYVNAVTPRDLVLEEVAQRHGFVRVEGTVEDVSITRTGRQRASVRAVAFRAGPEVYVHHTNVGVMVYLPENAAAALGQRVVVSGYLLPLDGPRNPGGFNEFQFFRSRGIDYKMFAEGLSVHEIILTPQMHVRNFGVGLAAVFDQTLPEAFAGIMKAMIVGDRTGLDNDVRDAYRAVGMFHILVVSGLHVAVLTAFIERTLKFFGMGLKSRSLLTILFILLFAILTGAGVATMRAAIMGIAFIAAGLFGYENDTPTTMAIAAAALLLHQPLFLFDAGFIYSFGVVAALVFATSPTQRALDMLSARYVGLKPVFGNWYVHKYLAGTLAANIAYIPINSFIFYEFSPLSPLVNFLLMPSVFFVIVLGFLMAIAGVMGAAGLFIAGLLAFPVWLLLAVYDFVIDLSLRLPFAVVITGRPGLGVMALTAAAIAAFVYIINAGKNIAKRLRRLCAVTALGLCVPLAANMLSPYINTTFLYVGQGEAAVISRGGNAIVIDGGGVFGRDAGENMGAFVLVPYLNYRGINRATAIVTHNHRDHSKGIVEAIMAGRIEHLILARANSQPGYYMYDELKRVAQAVGLPVTYVSAGDVIEFFDVRLYVKYPYDEQIFSGTNDSSLVLRMVHGVNSILFTGDIETAAEGYLTARGGNLTADILQVAHHGSRTSTTQDFLEAVNPRAAVISAGRNNMFNHPHPSVTRRLYDHGVEYFVTADRGAVLVRTNGRNMEISTMFSTN